LSKNKPGKRADSSLLNTLLKKAVIISTLILSFNVALALEKAILKGQVLDVEGKVVKGAEIFIYNTPDTRRPADFISARTIIHGRFSITIPSGKYWAVARLRKGEKYGPLTIGDKHSGEPFEIELDAGEEFVHDFTVVDIREAARLVKKTREGYFKLKGRIIDKRGIPVKNVYAISNREKDLKYIPDYLSAWTGEQGHYTIYLPRGKYYVGYASEFPPDSHYRIVREIDMEAERGSFDIMVDTER
jgi:hypothetical protein